MEAQQLIETVMKARQGDGNAEQALYFETSRRVYSHALRMVRSPQDAEDLTQEVFIAVHQKISELREPAAFIGWINQITINKCNAFLRKYKGAAFMDSDAEILALADDDPKSLPDKAIDDEDTRKIILEVIESLPDAQRACVLLYYYQQNTIALMSELLQINENTIKSRLALARAKIRAALEEKERKEGIRLYGIPLDLSHILQRSAEQITMPEGAGPRMWENISNAIKGMQPVGDKPNDPGNASGTAAQAPNIAGQAAAAAGSALAVKIIAVIAIAALITAGALTIPRMIKPPANADEYAVTGDDYYHSLSDSQKQFLSRLETALRATDYETAYGMQRSDSFRSICESMPDMGGFRYHPDNETTVIVYRTQQRLVKYNYNIALYSGEDGNGGYWRGAYDDFSNIAYRLYEAEYSGGKANGAFNIYYYEYDGSDEPELFNVQGDAKDGKVFGTSTVYKGGK